MTSKQENIEMAWAKKAVDWRNAEFQKRTIAVSKGCNNIDWINPDYRVCWSEILAANPIPERSNIVDIRYAFDKALKS